MKTKKIHYAGPIRTHRVRILAGWAACCSGDKAEQIRRDRQHTYDPAKVTCGACLRMIALDRAERAAILAEVKAVRLKDGGPDEA